MKWFRFYHEARTDRKLEALSDAQFRVWINLLCYAAEQEDRGQLEIESTYLLAVECARCDEQLLIETLSMLSKLGIVEYDDDEVVFVNWDKRQYESDNSTERVRAFRERQRNKEKRKRNVTETLQEQTDNVSSSVFHTDNRIQNTDTEKTLAPKPARVGKSDPLFESIAECWLGEPYPFLTLTKSQRGSINSCAKQLRQIDADPSDVPREWARLRERFDNPTPAALAKHWGTNGTGPKHEQPSSAVDNARALIERRRKPDGVGGDAVGFHDRPAQDARVRDREMGWDVPGLPDGRA